MNIENFSIAEFAWTIMNAVTLGVTFLLYHEARRDYGAVLRSGENGLFRETTRSSRRRHGLMLFMAAAFTAAGLYSGLFVPLNPVPEAAARASVTVTFLIAADVALMVHAFEAARIRLFTMDYLEAAAAAARRLGETQDQREDRFMGEHRRRFEQEHREGER